MAAHHGILVIDKPSGMTSHDVVAQVRRLARQKEVGHAGTLDPLATGVLVLGLGKATRLLEYLSGHDKQYDSTWKLGTSTRSDDADGEVLQSWLGLAQVEPPWPTHAQLEQALAQLVKRTEQVPPNVASIKEDGVAAHERSRAGERFTLPARPVVIHELSLVEYRPPEVRVHASVSKGTYIRALARDCGELLGTYAHVTQLRRMHSGGLSLADAVSWDTLLEAAHEPRWFEEHLKPIGFGLTLPEVVLDDVVWQRLSAGQRLGMDTFFVQYAGVESVLLGRHTAGLVILQARNDRGVWQPHKVIPFT